jgi:hypothetical protein
MCGAACKVRARGATREDRLSGDLGWLRSLTGKSKLSQNKEARDGLSAADQLDARGERARAMRKTLWAHRAEAQSPSFSNVAMAAPRAKSSTAPKAWVRRCPLRSISSSVGVPCMP